MLTLARLTLKGPYQAAAVVGLLALLAVTIRPLVATSLPGAIFALVLSPTCLLLSSVLVGLIILTQETISGLKTIAVSVLGISLMAWVLIDAPQVGLSIGLMQWLPIILLAQVLRSSKSLALTILVGVLIGVMAIAGQFFFWDESVSDWIQLVIQQVFSAPQSQESIAAYVDIEKMFEMALVAMSYVFMMLIVLMARWMQARLAESKGFGEEFRALTLGKPAATAAAIILLIGLWLPQAWIGSLGYLVMVAFMFQGIAVLHSKLALKKQSGFQLGLFYVLLISVWRIAMPLTAISGMVDNWLDFRKKPETPGNIN